MKCSARAMKRMCSFAYSLARLRVTASRPPLVIMGTEAFTPAMGFAPLYQTDDEWAAELINQTVHGVIHLGWVTDEGGGYRGQMAILVKPNGVLGRAYMTAITPFRYLIVYPRMLKEIGRKWLSYSADRS